MRRFALAFGVVVATVAACSSFSGGDDGTSPPPTEPANDGGPGTTNGQDSASDRADAAPLTIDGGGDPFSLSLQKTDDFERSSFPAGGPLDLHIGGTKSFDQNDCSVPAADPAPPSTACSPDTSIRFQANASQGPGGRGFLSADLDGSKRKLRFDFGMEIPGNPATQAQFAGVQLTDDINIFFEINDGRYRVGDQVPDGKGGFENGKPTSGELLDGTWAYYQIYVDLDAAVVVLQRDGVARLTHALSHSPSDGELSGLTIGITYTNAEADLQELFDNVGIGQY